MPPYQGCNGLANTIPFNSTTYNFTNTYYDLNSEAVLSVWYLIRLITQNNIDISLSYLLQAFVQKSHKYFPIPSTFRYYSYEKSFDSTRKLWSEHNSVCWYISNITSIAPEILDGNGTPLGMNMCRYSMSRVRRKYAQN